MSVVFKGSESKQRTEQRGRYASSGVLMLAYTACLLVLKLIGYRYLRPLSGYRYRYLWL